MYIAYFDESGDDGFPQYSSELFVLSCICMHESYWKENYLAIQDFRRHLKKQFGFPVKEEFHTKEFVTDKNPYHGKYTPEQRRKILLQHCQLLASLNVQCISVVINKLNIDRPVYHVLKNALTYAIQRIENDLNKSAASERFMMITDEGRVSKMRDTTRQLQKINYIPSMWNGGNYRKEIQNMIEDPLPKTSGESYFIQLADLLAFVISVYAKQQLCGNKIDWGNRIKSVLNYGDEKLLMDILNPRLNIHASRSNEYGIVYYPINKSRSRKKSG